jgi:hypothetical protein
MESSILSEVDHASILRTGLPTPLCLSSQLAPGLSPLAPRSGLERSDFVLWHVPDELIEIERIGSLAFSGRAYNGWEPTRLDPRLPFEGRVRNGSEWWRADHPVSQSDNAFAPIPAVRATVIKPPSSLA